MQLPRHWSPREHHVHTVALGTQFPPNVISPVFRKRLTWDSRASLIANPTPPSNPDLRQRAKRLTVVTCRHRLLGVRSWYSASA